MDEIARLGDLYQDQGLVFTTDTGAPVNPSNLRQRSLVKLLALRRSRCSLTVPSGESERLAFTRHRGIAFEAARSSLSRTSAS
jgi:hypothetical protein